MSKFSVSFLFEILTIFVLYSRNQDVELFLGNVQREPLEMFAGRPITWMMAFENTGKLITRDNLPNKPLLEAVLEIQWDPKQSRKNPFFSIFWGNLHASLNKNFPEIESLLPDIPFPEEVLQTMFHYRFYSKGKTLSIVQLGPGALSLHDADSYGWDSFKEKIAFVVESFFQSHPKTGDFSLRRLALKYVNFYECDFLKDNYCELTSGPLEGLNNKIKTLKRQSYGFRDQEYFKLKILAIHRTRYALVG